MHRAITVCITIIALVIIVLYSWDKSQEYMENVEHFTDTDYDYPSIATLSSVFNRSNISISKLKTKTLTASSANFLPKGLIIMWYGTTIPEGWALCDGTRDNPNFTDLFVKGEAGIEKAGNKGGSNTHKLTISQMPNHTHYRTTICNPSGMKVHASRQDDKTGNERMTAELRRGDLTDKVGLGEPFDITPPYVKLAYIVKL